MAIKFTANAAAGTYLPEPVTVKDSTLSFWLKFSTLPENGTAEVRRIVSLIDGNHYGETSDDDAFPFSAYILASDDAFYSLFDGRPAFGFDRGLYYYSWDITGDGIEIDIADGEWHHHTFVSRASSGALEWYIDGVLQREADSQVIDSIAWTGDWRRGLLFSAMTIGTEGLDYTGALADQAGLELYVNAPDGPMAEVAVWNVALGASDVARLVSGAPASLVRQNDLVSYQRLFEGSANFIAGADDVDNSEFGMAGYRETIVSTPASSHVVALPVEAAADQLALMIGTTFAQTFSTPAGWSLRETNTTDGEVSVLSKTLTAADITAGSVTISCAGSTNGIWHVYVFNHADRAAQIDLMETDLEVGERAQFTPNLCIKLMYARTRRTDNTMALDAAYDELLSGETAANSSSTDNGRLVTGYRGPEWDFISDAATAVATGTTDAIRTGIYFVTALLPESGISDGIDVEDHPPAVVAYQATISDAYSVSRSDIGERKRKDPDARLDYVWDWSAWLEDGDTIATCDVSAPAGITASVGQTDGFRVFSWLSGGSAGETHSVRCRITTSQGRIDDRSMQIQVLDR